VYSRAIEPSAFDVRIEKGGAQWLAQHPSSRQGCEPREQGRQRLRMSEDEALEMVAEQSEAELVLGIVEKVMSPPPDAALPLSFVGSGI
jgi:hypothetical protein